MSKWDQLKVIAQNASATGGFGMKLLHVEPRHILELISVAEKAQEIPEDDAVFVEQIWREMSRHANGMRPSNVVLRMALAEAVEFIELYRNGYKPGEWDGNFLEAQLSILAILEGEKTRGIPK